MGPNLPDHGLLAKTNLQPNLFRAKKTGLSDQRVTKKPGEFSNLVQT
jgi:hypothetical protein